MKLSIWKVLTPTKRNAMTREITIFVNKPVSSTEFKQKEENFGSQIDPRFLIKRGNVPRFFSKIRIPFR